MEKVIDLSKMAHERVPMVKRLVFDRSEGEDYIYKIDYYWTEDKQPGNLRISYDKGELLFIDFDGGPFLRVGCKIKNYIIKRFNHNGNFGNIEVVLNEISD